MEKSITLTLTEKQVSFLIEKLANTPCEQAGYRESQMLSLIGDAKRTQWENKVYCHICNE